MTRSDAVEAGSGDGLWVLEAENIHKHFGSLHVLKGITMRVARGEVVVVVGPSGGGASTKPGNRPSWTTAVIAWPLACIWMV